MRRHPASLLGTCLLVLAMLTPLSALAEENAADPSGSSYATWYGADFQGLAMANGEIYNMYNPTTAASNWFPLGTWVRVTNQANGKSVTVRVTDRGNFSWAFDLSYGAFAVIANPDTGRIAVSYQVVSGPAAVAPKSTPTPTVPAAKPAATSAQARAQVTSRGEMRSGGGTAKSDVAMYGDSLKSIAVRNGVSVSAILAVNDFPAFDYVYPGQVVEIP